VLNAHARAHSVGRAVASGRYTQYADGCWRVWGPLWGCVAHSSTAADAAKFHVPHCRCHLYRRCSKDWKFLFFFFF